MDPNSIKVRVKSKDVCADFAEDLETRFDISINHEVNRSLLTALSAKDDERLQAYDGVTSYPYDTGTGRVYKTEMIEYTKTKK